MNLPIPLLLSLRRKTNRILLPLQIRTNVAVQDSVPIEIREHNGYTRAARRCAISALKIGACRQSMRSSGGLAYIRPHEVLGGLNHVFHPQSRIQHVLRALSVLLLQVSDGNANKALQTEIPKNQACGSSTCTCGDKCVACLSAF